MVQGSTRPAARLLMGAGLALALTASSASAQSATAPFENLAGSWSGNGAVVLANGSKERIRCRVSYDVAEDGRSFQQSLRCASDSYTFDLKSTIQYADGYITGRWNESTRNKSGNISGRVSGNQIDALAETAGFSAFLTLTTRGNRQQVRIKSESTEITEVTIALGRGSR
jgi:hypothetical protein